MNNETHRGFRYSVQRGVAAVSLFLILSGSVFAARGVVSVRLDDCDYFLLYVSESDDYTLAEWYGGYDPEKGDVLYGKFNEYGFHNLYYGRRQTRVYVDDYGLDRGDALEQLYEQCD